MTELLGVFGKIDDLNKDNTIKKFNKSLSKIKYGSPWIKNDQTQILAINNFLIGIASNNKLNQEHDGILINVFGCIYNKDEIIRLNDCQSKNYLIEIFLKYGFQYMLN